MKDKRRHRAAAHTGDFAHSWVRAGERRDPDFEHGLWLSDPRTVRREKVWKISNKIW